MLWRSARPVASGSGATRLRHRHRFAGERRLGHLQLGLLDQARIGRHRVAGGQQHDVAGHQLARREHLLAAVAQHAHLQRGQPAQRGHRALGAAFLEAADQRVDQHHRQDDHRVAVVAQRHRQHRGDEQDVDQRALELAREGAPQRPRRRLGQGVGAMPRLAARRPRRRPARDAGSLPQAASTCSATSGHARGRMVGAAVAWGCGVLASFCGARSPRLSGPGRFLAPGQAVRPDPRPPPR